MVDTLDPIRCAFTVGRFANVSQTKVDVGLNIGEIGSMPGTEIVEDSNLIPGLEQGSNEVAPDKSGTAGYQDSASLVHTLVGVARWGRDRKRFLVSIER